MAYDPHQQRLLRDEVHQRRNSVPSMPTPSCSPPLSRRPSTHDQSFIYPLQGSNVAESNKEASSATPRGRTSPGRLSRSKSSTDGTPVASQRPLTPISPTNATIASMEDDKIFTYKRRRRADDDSQSSANTTGLQEDHPGSEATWIRNKRQRLEHSSSESSIIGTRSNSSSHSSWDDDRKLADGSTIGDALQQQHHHGQASPATWRLNLANPASLCCSPPPKGHEDLVGQKEEAEGQGGEPSKKLGAKSSSLQQQQQLPRTSEEHHHHQDTAAAFLETYTKSPIPRRHSPLPSKQQYPQNDPSKDSFLFDLGRVKRRRSSAEQPSPHGYYNREVSTLPYHHHPSQLARLNTSQPYYDNRDTSPNHSPSFSTKLPSISSAPPSTTSILQAATCPAAQLVGPSSPSSSSPFGVLILPMKEASTSSPRPSDLTRSTSARFSLLSRSTSSRSIVNPTQTNTLPPGGGSPSPARNNPSSLSSTNTAAATSSSPSSKLASRLVNGLEGLVGGLRMTSPSRVGSSSHRQMVDSGESYSPTKSGGSSSTSPFSSLKRNKIKDRSLDSQQQQLPRSGVQHQLSFSGSSGSEQSGASGSTLATSTAQTTPAPSPTELETVKRSSRQRKLSEGNGGQEASHGARAVESSSMDIDGTGSRTASIDMADGSGSFPVAAAATSEDPTTSATNGRNAKASKMHRNSSATGADSQEQDVNRSIESGEGSSSARAGQLVSPLSMPTTSSIPPTLKGYDVVGTLGTGTFGRVLLLRRKDVASTLSNQGGYFALKALEKNRVVKMKQVEHVNSERDILSRVRHPGVVSLERTYQDSNCIYLLMEFVRGGEIFSYLRRAGRFPTEVARFYIASLVLVLEHLHSQNIIYRDLKPENLLLDSSGYIKVTDFGFAKHLNTSSRTFTLCGTPEFLAPEVIQGIGHGKAADWWALGILCYEFTCGFPPYCSGNPFETYEKILKGDLQFPKHVDVVTRDLIRSLLSSNLSQRLGNLAGGSQDVKRHLYFHTIDWNALSLRNLAAPIIPTSNELASPLTHFARYAPPDFNTMPGLFGEEDGVTWENRGEFDELFKSF